jgi:tetraacyldisaccharide 4'-kinase
MSANVTNVVWYQKNVLAYLLLPLSLLYWVIISIRRILYKIHFFKTHRLPCPVIVVGNITVGGTGKTPVVIALVNECKKRGLRPGVISRGYGRKSSSPVEWVTAESDPRLTGDEPVIIARATGVPMVVGKSRVAAASALLAKASCDVIISDDGLQHYALARDIEIAVIDGTRRFGNGFCLPAGPLREMPSRLNRVDFVINNSGSPKSNEYLMQVVMDEVVLLNDETQVLSWSALSQKKVVAIAGIGNPARFFDALRKKGVVFTARTFPDHHDYQKSDFDFLNDEVVIMTEKDAVKCSAFSDRRFYVARGHVDIDPQFFENVFNALIKSAPVMSNERMRIIRNFDQN